MALDNVFLLEFLGCEFVSCLLAFGYPSFILSTQGRNGFTGNERQRQKQFPFEEDSKKGNGNVKYLFDETSVFGVDVDGALGCGEYLFGE